MTSQHVKQNKGVNPWIIQKGLHDKSPTCIANWKNYYRLSIDSYRLTTKIDVSISRPPYGVHFLQ